MIIVTPSTGQSSIDRSPRRAITSALLGGRGLARWSIIALTAAMVDSRDFYRCQAAQLRIPTIATSCSASAEGAVG